MTKAVLFLCLLALPALVTLTDVSDTSLPVADLTKNSMDVVAADLDKDGDNDLVIACEFCPNLVLINDGSGKFANESTARLPQKRHDSEDIAAEDFDRDGDLDLVFVSEDDKMHEYYINDGKGYFTDASDRLAWKTTSNAVCAVDIDGDGDKDLVLGNAGQDVLLQNDGKGRWKDITTTHFPADDDVTQDVKSFDADRDGDPDLVFGNEDAGKIYRNDGTGKFTAATAALPEVVATVETRKVEVEDIDKDGDADLFFCSVAFRPGRSRENLVLLNDGKGRFSDGTAEHYKGENNLMSLDAQFMDLDGDGWKDLIVSNGFGGRVQYFQNRKGTFAELTGMGLPDYKGADVISLLHFNGAKGKQFIYLGVFRGPDKLLQVK
jgi:hypothetical protein